jgi:LCP family protein required for cell wall assembly
VFVRYSRHPGSNARLVAQTFATNTPRPVSPADVTFPPPNTPALTLAAPEPPPAADAAATPATAPDTQAVPPTPRPLPTLIRFGDSPPEGATAATAIPTAVEWVDRRGQNLINILLLGNDGELSDDGFLRTDTMIIVSINRDTGTVAMLSLPRDLYVYITDWTMQRLNLAYIHGETAGFTDGGFGQIRSTILYNFGINVHYYAMVDLTGMRAIIDRIGGIELAVDCAIQDLPLIGADVPAAAGAPDVDGFRTLPVGYYQMTGGEALWYARSRHNSIEFDRGRRQQQVLRAIWRKARDTGLLANVLPLWNELQPYLQTNLTIEDLISLVPIALNLDPSRIESFYMLRLYHTTPWTTPAGENVQLPVYDTIRVMLEDFYTPPTTNQARVEGARIRVLNATANADWDRVAAERLAYSGFVATAAGSAPTADSADTILIDYTGAEKGSSLQSIADILNVRPENIQVRPDPNRTVDFEVILGANYNSCTEQAVQPVEGG